MVRLSDSSIVFGTGLRQDLKQTEIENTFMCVDTEAMPVVLVQCLQNTSSPRT